MGNDFQIITTVDIEEQTIRDILCTAFDEACNYWCEVVDVSLKDCKLEDFKSGGQFNPVKNYGSYETPESLIALHPGCGIIIEYEDPSGDDYRRTTIDRDLVTKGLQIMAAKYRRMFEDIVKECHDIETSDVLLQCCVFGEIVFS